MKYFRLAVSLLALTGLSVLGINEEGTRFLEENKDRKGVTTLKSGLQYEVLASGSEERYPGHNTKCIVRYRGTLLSGEEFDASRPDRNVTLTPMQVIPGWSEALRLMRAGDKWKLFVPSDLGYGEKAQGYGDREAGKKIPGGSVLIFELELVEIVRGPDLFSEPVEFFKEHPPVAFAHIGLIFFALMKLKSRFFGGGKDDSEEKAEEPSKEKPEEEKVEAKKDK